MAKLDTRNMDAPDEVRTLPNTSIHIAKFDGHTVGRFTFEPGWKWSENVKPMVGTQTCQAYHVGFCSEGRLQVEAEDGSTIEIGPGDSYAIPPGHNAWVLGDERFVGLEFMSAAEYGKK